MFQFKGTAAADASSNADERDWRVADHCNIQQLGRRPFTTMLQPTLHHRSMTEDTRRPSAVQSRSRSTSSVASQSFVGETRPARNLSIDDFISPPTLYGQPTSGGHAHARGGHSDSFGKTLMAKGSRLLRRQNNNHRADKHDLTPLSTLDWLEDTSGRDYLEEVSNESGSRYSRMNDASPRWNISEPFNFQHLTHTTPQHVQIIQQKDHHDLVSEFSAIRAAQAPRRELRGIKAMDIQQGNYFAEASASETSSPPRTGYSNTLPESPARDQGRSNPPSPTRARIKKRSIENFSQPNPYYHTAQSPPISPPAQSSSNIIAPGFFTFHQELPDESTFDTQRSSDNFYPLDDHSPSWSGETYPSSMPHAVTTPDDTAHLVRPPPFSLVRTELAGVPEEDEMSEGKRSSIATSIVRPTTPTSSIRHAKSFPSTKSSPQRWSDALPLTTEEDSEKLPRGPMNSVNDVDPSAQEHRDEVPARPPTSMHTWIRREESWEDVIDYCYEHKAEADCNFDWDLASTSEGPDLSFAGPQAIIDPKNPFSHLTTKLGNIESFPSYSAGEPRPSSSTYSSSPPSLQFLQTSLPDLQPPTSNSVDSSFSSIPEAVTPVATESILRTKMPSPNPREWTIHGTTSPIVMPEDPMSGYAFDDLYRDMLASHACGEHQHPFNTGRVDGSTISNSPRSSRSPISKSSSQESFWCSQAGVAARRHRNAGSVGSLPDLIQSRSNEKVDHVCDHLADHAALLNVSDIPVDGSARRRSPNLAKDVALKSILSKVKSPDDPGIPEVPPPVHPAFRERANSDASSLAVGCFVLPPPQTMLAKRMRSTSSASSLATRKTNRASYSLFPSPPSR